MERLLEEAELDEEQEKKLEREFAREYHLITRDDRLEKIAEDIVAHFMGRGIRARRWWFALTRPRRSGCTTRCRSTGRNISTDLEREAGGSSVEERDALRDEDQVT